MIRVLAVAGAVDASGDGTIYAPNVGGGHVAKVRYVPDAGANPLATGADITITEEASGAAILTITNVGTVAAEWAPRDATHTIAGVAALYAAGGVAVNALKGPPVFNSRIKLVIAQGGASKLSGAWYFWIEQ